MNRRQFLLAVACASVFGHRCATVEGRTDQFVNIGGRRLHARTWGRGNPAVVIDVGIGETVDPWLSVIDRVSSSTRVCAYDRGGYGSSDVGTFPRTASQVALELHLLLSGLALAPPFVFAGHSLGAAHVMVVAAKYPAEVAALVLLDPPPLGFITGERFPGLRELAAGQTGEFRRMAAEARAQNQAGRAAFFETLASEHEEMFTTTAAEILRIRSFDGVPVTVLASEVANARFGPDAEAFQRFWIESNEGVAAMSRRGRCIVAKGSTHQIQRDAADLVAREILELVAAARGIAPSQPWKRERRQGHEALPG